MIQIAIFSDIHGNLPALNAVLADIQSKNIYYKYCLGDLVDFAPWGNEVIELIKNEKIPCLMGNHDERIAFDLPIIPLEKHDAEETENRIIAIKHSKETITHENKLFLGQLPYLMQLDFKVKHKHWKIQLIHGSLESNEAYLYASEPNSTFEDIFFKTHADIIVMGHTHLPFIKDIDKKWAINTGSVGRSKRMCKDATYLLVELHEDRIHTEIIQVPFDIIAVAHEIKASGIPDFYAEFLLSE
ncbi:metallophosphoesterase family protein [Sphingobacterium sp. UDSM-2020]|uniref:metallophosphoesterase family protein n=1 Tax=Sphingobacterium sp. UDSM-2020 TaxID=2795738 RepID=UPI001938A005|nr:metallophosphoesterase [Sphingobacterium sp. UDSM-2020]QQD13767.1 metallophosphoesterase family protein [Sphingobacterium sp. UDSM-2020]